MASRSELHVRLSDEGIARAQEIADVEFEGVRSAAVRRLLLLGLAAWDAGCRKPEDVGRRPVISKESLEHRPDPRDLPEDVSRAAFGLPSAAEARAAKRERMQR